jgi:SAM-dependent methyltransferase
MIKAKIYPSQKATQKDYLWLHLRDLPYFRAILRAIEARFYQEIDLPAPTLDIGCGDGHFASLTFDRPLEVGLDPWWEPIHEASHRAAYRLLTRADGGRMPFSDGYFSSAVSNSVLEHIPHLEVVLSEAARVLKPGAPFIFCGPNHRFLDHLSVARGLDQVGLHGPAGAYRAFFNRISRHYHSDSPQVWQARLEQAGFEIIRYWHYFPPKALQTLEWGHYLGLPSLMARKLTGKWVLVPQHWNLAPVENLLRPLYAADPVCADGVCTFYIARRKGA